MYTMNVNRFRIICHIMFHIIFNIIFHIMCNHFSDFSPRQGVAPPAFEQVQKHRLRNIVFLQKITP